MFACDFFTVETISRRRLYVLFFIELGSRRVQLAGCTTNPSGAWGGVSRTRILKPFTEPDGSYSWAVLSAEGELLQHGVADAWDDAWLGAIENLYPPSAEGD
jgi:hypothetical protein